VSRYVLDADAWLNLRSLNTGNRRLVDCLLTLDHPFRPTIVTEWIAKRELATIESELSAALAANQIEGKTLPATDPLYRELRRTVDRGEAEAIAWMANRPNARELLVFATCDRGAMAAARARRVECTDILGVVIDMLRAGALGEDEAAVALSVWDDKSQQRGRPSDWRGFSETRALRLARGFPYPPG
jgi:predicted nucleic acid-binding protein